jgi:hypothetical protein
MEASASLNSGSTKAVILYDLHKLIGFYDLLRFIWCHNPVGDTITNPVPTFASANYSELCSRSFLN